MLTKKEILIDNKTRVEEALCRIQLHPVYNGIRFEDECLILKCLNDLLEKEINRAKE